MSIQSKRFFSKWAQHAVITTITLLTSLPVVAQTAIEEVLVTATRRGETDIQTTPISVTALDEEALDTLLLHDITDIAAAIPNLISGNVAGFNAASFGLRGVGQTSIILYQEAPVGVTLDDFVLPHIQTQALEPFDIEAVEVLRGPQGTLFGKNTTAGVINVRTKRPVLNERSVEARVLYGEFNTLETRFAGNFGTDTFAVRAAGMYQKSDGYYEGGKTSTDIFGQTFSGGGKDLGGDDVFSGRFKALWQPNDSLKAMFQYEIIRDRQDSPPVVNETPNDIDPATGFPILTFPLLGFAGVDSGDPLKQVAISNRDDGLRMQDGHQVDVDGYYLNLDWDIGAFSLHSVTGYREQDSHLPSTYTGEAAASLFDASRDDRRETFQQEIRVTSNFDGPVNFVAGGFYQSNDAEFCVLQFLGFLDYFTALGVPGINPNAALGAQGYPLLTIDNQNDNPSILCNAMDATAYAGFADATWDVTDRISLGGGVRVTHEKKEWAGRPQTYLQYLNGISGFDANFGVDDLGDLVNGADFGRYPFNVYRNEESWTEPSYRVTGSFQATDDIFTWLTYSHGVKSGTYNDQTGTSLFFVPGAVIPELALEPVDPETADSVEVGVKADLLDNRLRVNAVFFNVNYEDAQRELVTVVGAFQETRFFNAAEIEARGIELEATAAVTEGLTLQANLSWQDVEYKRFRADTDFDGVVDLDLSNTDVTRAPEWTAFISATYSHNLGGLFTASHNINFSYESENIHVGSPVSPKFNGVIEDKTILNWSSTVADINDRYFIRVFGKNLTDERYRTGILPVANLWTMTSYGAPRWFGVEIGGRFDL